VRSDLTTHAARWRATRAAGDLVDAATLIAPGTDRGLVRAVLGDPLVVSQLAHGGESWLYVRVEPEAGQLESVSLVFDGDGAFARIDRKPVD
jgi:hypothetical protein